MFAAFVLNGRRVQRCGFVDL